MKNATQFVNRYNAFARFVNIKRCEGNQVFADLQNTFKQPETSLKNSIKNLVNYFPITTKTLFTTIINKLYNLVFYYLFIVSILLAHQRVRFQI